MLKIHFLNVGRGDCCIIEFPERLAVIDINRTSEMDKESQNEVLEQLFSPNEFAQQKILLEYSIKTATAIFEKAGYTIKLTDPISYLTNLDKTSIFRFISTHPHMDHLTGLAKLIDNFSLSNIWIIKNDISPDIDKLSEEQKDDWETYKKYRDCEENKKDGITIVRPVEGDSRDFWQQDGIKILAPNDDFVSDANKNSKPNDMSYVLLINYGQCKIVLGGDAEEKIWKYLVENYKDEISGVSILKASHHGRDTGYYQPAVKLMSPEYTIVSVGKKPDNDASNKYRKYSDYVFSTRWKGNIVFECKENGTITCTTEYDR